MQNDLYDENGDDHLLTWVPRLRRYARALVGNREDADDLVQDTLERALAKSALWRGVSDMRAWLFGMMHNLHVDGVRRPKLHTVILDDDTPEVPVAATQGESLAVMDLQAALEKLPVEQREIILLIALEDMSYAEVAATLGIPIGSVMSRLSREHRGETFCGSTSNVSPMEVICGQRLQPKRKRLGV